LLIEATSYVDDNRNEWIAGYVLEEETRVKLFEVWLKNGEQIVYKIYVDRKTFESFCLGICSENTKLTTKLIRHVSVFTECMSDKEME